MSQFTDRLDDMDATIFSGDALEFKENREALVEYATRWLRQVLTSQSRAGDIPSSVASSYPSQAELDSVAAFCTRWGQRNVSFWSATRLNGASVSMAAQGDECVELVRLFDRVRDAIKLKHNLP